MSTYIGVDAILEHEAMTVGNPCTLLRYWETDIHGGEHQIATIIYEHGYGSFPDMVSIRFAVYCDGRQGAGGIVA